MELRARQVNSRPLETRSASTDRMSLEVLRNVPDQPEETLSGRVLLRFDLVAAEVLDVFRLGRGGKLAVTDLLYAGKRSQILSHVVERCVEREGIGP